MDSQSILKQLCPPLDKILTEQLINEFLDAEQRYLLGDWEPHTLNGGQFAEISARIVYHIDSGNLSRRRMLNNCLTYIEDPTNSNSHAFQGRRTSLHICKVLRTLYKFRSQRGAVHIDPDYTANELDSTLVMAFVRWTMSEILRVFWSADRSQVARAIKEIIRYEVPAVLNIDDQNLVLRTDCTIEEEILLLLHNAGEVGLTSTEVVNSTPRNRTSVQAAISKLVSANKRQITRRSGGNFVLTPNGAKRVHDELGPRLSV